MYNPREYEDSQESARLQKLQDMNRIAQQQTTEQTVTGNTTIRIVKKKSKRARKSQELSFTDLTLCGYDLLTYCKKTFGENLAKKIYNTAKSKGYRSLVVVYYEDGTETDVLGIF